MNPVITRRVLLLGGLASGLAAGIRPTRACEIDARFLRIVHPWTRAARASDAFAIVCMSFEDVSVTDRLVGVVSPVATRAVLQQGDQQGPVDFLLPAGQASALTEEGVHVRLLGLRQPLEIGRVYPMALHFEQSGVVDAELTVDLERLA
jgi:periplasmic copper chaperone A